MRLGMALFLGGLITGLALSAGVFKNPRLGVSAHLIAVMNGLFLLVTGLIWRHLRLEEGPKAWTYRFCLFGTFANWFFTALGASFGTKMFTPIAGAGYDAAQWQEMVVGAGLSALVVAMLGASSLLLHGLRGDDG